MHCDIFSSYCNPLNTCISGAENDKTFVQSAKLPDPKECQKLLSPVGLQNLGNTCFFNSVMQVCAGFCPSVYRTTYFARYWFTCERTVAQKKPGPAKPPTTTYNLPIGMLTRRIHWYKEIKHTHHLCVCSLLALHICACVLSSMLVFICLCLCSLSVLVFITCACVPVFVFIHLCFCSFIYAFVLVGSCIRCVDRRY